MHLEKKQKETQPQYLTRLKSVHNLPIKFHFIRQFQPSNGWPSPAIMVSVGALDFIRINRISSNSKTETLDWVCTVWKVWKKYGKLNFPFPDWKQFGKPEALDSIPSYAAWNFPLLRPDVSAFFISTGVLGMVYLMYLPRQDQPLCVINSCLVDILEVWVF